jgi:Zn-dependent peptidase ImmA (M78 family)
MPSNLNLEKAATEFRGRYGYNTINPIRIKSLLQQLNVLTIFRKMNEAFSGMSLKIGEDKFILINSVHSLGRQHFTIFHELYHLYVQKDFEHIICDNSIDKKDKKEEENANLFAANLMLPRDGLLKFISSDELKKDTISLSTILGLEQYYSCSHKAMLIRLEDLHLISESLKVQFSVDIKTAARQYGYDTSLYESGNDELVIGDYGVKAKKLFDENIISKAHYLELMRDLGIDLGDNTNSDERKE